MGRGRRTEDLAGRRFGKWKVLERCFVTGRANAMWLCECACGLKKSVSSSHLRQNKSVSCRRCSETKSKGRLSSRVWHRIKYQAAKRNIPIDLGETDTEGRQFLYDLLQAQNSLCALTGMPISLSDTIVGDQHGQTTASVDRRDPAEGYTRTNVQWVHKWINIMKSDHSEEEFVAFCEAVVNHKCIMIDEIGREVRVRAA